MWKCTKVEIEQAYHAVNLENASTTIFSEVSFPVISRRANLARMFSPSYGRKY
jgi:hypothetical protein